MQKDYAVTLSQRSYLLDFLTKRYKELGKDLNSEIIWEITGRISLAKYRYLLALLYKKNDEILMEEIKQLIQSHTYV